MRSRKLALTLTSALATMAVAIGAQAANAVFPNFSGCTATNNVTEGCIDVQQRSGNLNIKGFNVPLGESLEIRGTLREEAGGAPLFVPPSGTTGFFSRPVPVPGGVFGIEWLPGNSVLAITELAGTPSQIRVNTSNLSIRIPVKVRLVNLLLGMDCHIGTNSNPVPFNLIIGTTEPPPPNSPISGALGTIGRVGNAITFTGTRNVENSFAVPGATECGFGLGLINSLVNLRLRLPSAAGNNSVELINDLAVGLP